MAIAFRQAQLPNGLTILAEVDPDAHTAAAGFFVRTGARDEASAVMGVSHFLEHMMFKGTPSRTANQVNEQFDDLGASHNAFTTSELTAFWAHTLPEHLPGAMDILADILRPSLRQADFDEERGVILEEIAMYEDQPMWVIYEHTLERYYAEHALRHRVLGTRETISALSRDQMDGYFRNRYSADNTVVALAGRIDLDGACEQIARACEGWQATRPSGRVHPTMPARDAFVLTRPNITRCYGIMAMPGPAIQQHERYAAAVVSQILGDTEGSRLYWALIETGLAEEASAQYDGRDGCGEQLISYVCSPSSAEEVEAIALKEMRGFEGSLTEDDLRRARSKIATAVTLAGERPAGRMRRLGQLWMYGLDYRTLEQELEEINRLKLDDLRAVFARYPLEPYVRGRLVPAGG